MYEFEAIFVGALALPSCKASYLLIRFCDFSLFWRTQQAKLYQVRPILAKNYLETWIQPKLIQLQQEFP